MKAIAFVPGTPGARIVERPEPSVSAPDDVKLRMLRGGICGTGREELSAGTIVGAGGAEGIRNRPRDVPASGGHRRRGEIGKGRRLRGVHGAAPLRPGAPPAGWAAPTCAGRENMASAASGAWTAIRVNSPSIKNNTGFQCR